jgi:hypothetical protein
MVKPLSGHDSAKLAVKNCFIRGSVVRYVQIPAGGVDTQLLEDATRRGSYLAATPYFLSPGTDMC